MAALHDRWVAVTAIVPDKGGAVCVIANHLGAGQSKEGMAPLVLFCEIVGNRRNVDVGSVVDDVILDRHFHCVLRVLQIDQIIPCVPVSRILHVSKGAQPAASNTSVGQLYTPAFEGLSQGNKVSGFGCYAVILRRDNSVGAAVAALGLVPVERLAHRLPCRGPIILALVVVEIDGPAGLIEGNGVEAQAHEAAQGR